MDKRKLSSALVLRFAAYGCLLIFAVGVLCYGISTKFGFKDLPKSTEEAFAYTYIYEEDAASLRNISVDWLGGPVTLRFYAGDTVIVKEHARRELQEHEKLQLELSGGDLEVHWGSSWLNIDLFAAEEKELELVVPRKFAKNFDEITFRSMSGDFLMEGVKAEKIQLQTLTGNMQLANIEAEEIKLSANSGSITGEALVSTEKLRIGTTSGNMQLHGLQGKSVTLDTTSGEIILEGTAEEMRFTNVSGKTDIMLTAWPERIEGDTVSGNTDITANEAEEGFVCRFKSVSGDFYSTFETAETEEGYLHGAGLCEVNVTTTSGNVKLNKAGEPLG